MTIKSVLAAVALLLLTGPAALAQTSNMSIVISGYNVGANGPEVRAGVPMSVLLTPNSLNKAVSSAFHASGCGFVVTPASADLQPTTYVNWRVEVTPLRVDGKAATFRLRWSRVVDKSGRATLDEDVELTLKLGESRPIDILGTPPHKATDGPPCDAKAQSLRASLEFTTFDRRLLAFDVWLVERLANGKEESQLQSVRGLPDHDVPFYFDTVADGAVRIDFFGRIIATAVSDSIGLDIEVVKGKPDTGQSGYQAAYWFRSNTRVKPGETIEVALPSRASDEALRGRTFSLRIRAKQVR